VRDSKLLLRLLRLQLQGDPPAAAILNIVLAADAARPRVAQSGLFLPPSPDPEKLDAIIRVGRPVIFFQNHAGQGPLATFPSRDDFAVAALVSFMTYARNPGRTAEFRIVQLGEEQDTVVAYGFKGTALEDIKDLALAYRDAAVRHGDAPLIEAQQDRLDAHLATEAFADYLQHVCPVDPAAEANSCRTHPEYFLWPSERFFIHHRAP